MKQAKTGAQEVSEIPIVGKVRYMAPEILRLIEEIRNPKRQEAVKVDYDPEKADVYSLGVVLGSLCSMELMDNSETRDVQNKKLEKIRTEFPKLHPLVLDMLKTDVLNRKTFRKLGEYIEEYSGELKKFPFFELEFESGLKVADVESKETKV